MICFAPQRDPRTASTPLEVRLFNPHGEGCIVRGPSELFPRQLSVGRALNSSVAKFGVVSVVQISATGVGTTLGRIQLNSKGRLYFASKIVISGSEMAVLSQRGYVGWYKLPLA